MAPPNANRHEIDICIVDEKEVESFLSGGLDPTPMVVLCKNATGAQTASRHRVRSVAEYVSKPIGPRKLARALRSCIDKARLVKSGLAPAVVFPDEPSPMESETGTEVPDPSMNYLTLEGDYGGEIIEVQTNEIVTASESENAQMAIDRSSTPDGSTPGNAKDDPFFPAQKSVNEQAENVENRSPSPHRMKKSPYHNALVRRESRRPPLTSRMTEPLAKAPSRQTLDNLDRYGEGITFPVQPFDQMLQSSKKELMERKNATRSDTRSNGIEAEKTASPKSNPQHARTEKRLPRLLLVDDNSINLRLLETYMRKRKYRSIDSAENGQYAVQAAEALESSYDIIFMGQWALNHDRVIDQANYFRHIHAGDEWFRGNESNS